MTPPKKRRGDVQPHGQIRQSQIVTTFGPGAMIDLPDHAVMLAGLDHWSGWDAQPVPEARLEAKVRNLLGRPFRFYTPPADVDDPNGPVIGITAWLFPEWFVAHAERHDPGQMRSRPLVHRLDLDKGMKFRLDSRSKAERIDELAWARKMPAVKLALERFSDAEIWAEMERRRKGGGGPAAKGIREAEIETQAADHIDAYLATAIDMGRLCSNDPVCAQHQPDDRQEDRLLSGAACHGCVLLAESSCERRNDFLDRALVVPTVDEERAAFFDRDDA